MAVPDAREEAEAPDEIAADEIAALCTCPGTTVFTEEGNSDAWIATDTTVDLER